ncbi:MAG: hypothetical protein JO188_15150 [Hyphomicrobiales bacterium]|nr:hypothetical protein [Hyphomicrobiales bacterium]
MIIEAFSSGAAAPRRPGVSGESSKDRPQSWGEKALKIAGHPFCPEGVVMASHFALRDSAKLNAKIAAMIRHFHGRLVAPARR